MSKIIKNVSTSVEEVDKYAGKSKKEFIEMKSDEIKRANKTLNQKDVSSRAEGAWKSYNTKHVKERKKQAKQNTLS